MKIRLTKPLPQIGKVVPAGVILDDAPEALKEKLVRQGRAEWVESRAGDRADPPPAPLPSSSAVVEQADRIPEHAEEKGKVVEEAKATPTATAPVKRKRKKAEE